MLLRARLALAAFGLLVALPALATDLSIRDARIRHMPAELPMAGYFTLANTGSEPRRLVSASSDAYGEVMVHQSMQQGDQMRMMHVDAVEVPAGAAVAFAPGGYHLMLMKPTRGIAIGEQIPVTLQFADGEQLTAQFKVQPPTHGSGHGH